MHRRWLLSALAILLSIVLVACTTANTQQPQTKVVALKPDLVIGAEGFSNIPINKITTLYFYITPLLLFINSFLFKEDLLKFFSILLAGFFGCFILFVFLVQLALGNHINLVERVECPNGKILSVYENFEPSFLTSDDAICRFELQQDRIFIGVIKNSKEVGEKKCQVNTREPSFPNRLINACT